MVVLWDDPKFVHASEDCNYTFQKGQWPMPKHPKILSKNWWNPRINLSMSEYPRIPRILFHEDLWAVQSWDDPEYVWVSQDSQDTFPWGSMVGGILGWSWACLSIPGFPGYFSMRVYGWRNPGIILSMSEYPRIPRILFH